MVGLIWLIQLVHYPLFAGVGSSGWRVWHERHASQITPLVGVLMAVEGLSYLMLLSEPMGTLGRRLFLASGVLLALHLCSTAFVQVPLHGKLGAGHDEATIAQLVRTNWIRTFAWTGRGVLVAWLMVLVLRGDAEVAA